MQNSTIQSVVLAKQLRNAKKIRLNQKKLGETIGVARQRITRIESGTQNGTIETLQKLTSALDYDFTIELKQKKRSKRYSLNVFKQNLRLKNNHFGIEIKSFYITLSMRETRFKRF